MGSLWHFVKSEKINDAWRSLSAHLIIIFGHDVDFFKGKRKFLIIFQNQLFFMILLL